MNSDPLISIGIISFNNENSKNQTPDDNDSECNINFVIRKEVNKEIIEESKFDNYENTKNKKNGATHNSILFFFEKW